MVLGIQVQTRTDKSICQFLNVYTKANYYLNHFIPFYEEFQPIVNLQTLNSGPNSVPPPFHVF